MSPGRSVFSWDQIALPRSLRRHGIDVLFNPKYSFPLSGPLSGGVGVPRLDWYVMPWASRFIDRLSHRFSRAAIRCAGQRGHRSLRGHP